MRIAIEAVNANKEPENGSQTYLYNLIRSLIELDREDNFFLYVDRPINQQSFINRRNVYYRHIREVKYIYGACKRTFFDDPWSEFFVAMDMLLKIRPDIYMFNVGSIPPFIRRYKTICMVHDLSERYIPECYSEDERNDFLRNKSRALSVSTHLAALSNQTREDAIQFMGVPEEKIVVIYPGYNKHIFNTERDDNRLFRLKNNLNISDRYIITTGMIHPKKNLVRLAGAFINAKNAGKFDGQFLIVGPDKYRSKEIRHQIKELDCQGDIIFAGCLPLADMAELLKGAELFVFPALYEGFGLSMLEAMACGIPVVTSNTGALPEVADGNALLVDPYNVVEMGQAIAEAINNKGLRDRLRQGALRRANEFSWDRAARQYIHLFKELGARKSSWSINIR